MPGLGISFPKIFRSTFLLQSYKNQKDHFFPLKLSVPNKNDKFEILISH